MKKGYNLTIEKVVGNDEVSIARVMEQLRDFRKLHPAPPPPDKPMPRQKRKK